MLILFTFTELIKSPVKIPKNQKAHSNPAPILCSVHVPRFIARRNTKTPPRRIKGIVHWYMVPNSFMEFHGKSSRCQNTTRRSAFKLIKSCSPISSAKNSMSPERMLSSKYGMVTKGRLTVSHFIKLISIVP